MASDFLKKKAEQQAAKISKEFGENAYGGTKWLSQNTGIKTEGGNKPSSDQPKNASKVSSFLQKKASEQAQKTTERFGAEAYGGSEWLEEKTGIAAPERKPVTMQELADRAELEYQNYLGSETHLQVLRNYNKEHKWDGLKNALANPMGGGSFGLPAMPVVDPREQELRAKADYYKLQVQKEADNAVMEADRREWESWNDADRAALELYTNNRLGSLGNIAQIVSAISSGSGTQQAQAAIRAGQVNAAYEQLAKKYGADRVKQLAESYERFQNQQTSEEVAATAKEAASGDGTTAGKWGAGALHSGISVGANLVNAMTGPVGLVSELSHRTGRYSTLDPNNAGNIYGDYASAVRGQVAENISGDKYDILGKKVSDGGTLRQAGATLYEAGMSAADSLARIFTAGGNEAISLGLAATGSFSQTVSQASKQGANPVQAVAMGVLDGGLEVLTEKVSLDNLFKAAAAGPKNFKQIVKEILKTGAIEVSEEEMSFLGSTLLEAAILREKSDYSQRVQQMVMNGQSWEQAKKAADRSVMEEAVNTAVTSFLSGGMMGGGAQVVSAFQTNQIGRDFAKLNLDEADIQDLIDSGLESAEDTESHQIATEIQQQINAGKKPSNYDLARLWQANRQTIDEEMAAEEEMENPPAVTAEGEGVTKNGQSVTGQAKNVTQEQQNVPRAPLSIAEQIRQNKLNQGGIINGTEGNSSTAAGGTGAGVLSGSGQWVDGAGTGEPVGGLAGRAGQAAIRKETAERNAAAVGRVNRIQSLRLPTVSTKELGLPSGTESRNIRVVPQEHWDLEMEQLAERLYQETGKTVTYVTGRIQVKGADRRVRNVNGAVYGDRIVVRADSLHLSMEQIADHEAYHSRVTQANAWRPGWLNSEVRQHIIDNFSREEFEAVVTEYMRAMDGIYDMSEGLSEAEYQKLLANIEEEVLADAYAGINAFRAGADRFTSAVNEKMEQLGLNRYRAEEQANGVRETAGPPSGERFSVNADFASEVEVWAKAGMETNQQFVLGSTGDVLQGLGAIESDIYMQGDKIAKILKDHPEMRLDIIEKIPQIVDNPALVLKSKNVKNIPRNTRLVMFGSIKADNGQPVLCVLDLRPVENRLVIDDMQKVSSAYTKDDPASFVQNSDVLYADKKRTAKLLRTIGLHRPIELQRSGYIGSISYIGQNVNIVGVPFTEIIREVDPGTEDISDEEFQERYGLKLRAVDEDTGTGNGERFSYAGEGALTANSQTLGEAKGLEQMGVDAETIRQETGWFRGKDGKWRFEVDDSTAQVADEIINYMTLGELLPGAEIFKAYPNLEDVSVVFQSLEPGVNASYDPRFDSIDVDYKLKSDPEAIRAAVLHEVQHVIQRWEGFSKGTNVRAWERKIRDGFDSRKASDIREAAEAERQLEQFRMEEPDLYRDMMELDAMAPDLPRGAVNWDTLEQIEEDPPEWQAYDARRDQLEEIYGDRMWDFYSALHDMQRINKRMPRTAEELYWDTAGEIEARNVAGRRNLTAEQRKNTPPILGGEDTVFAEGNEVSYALSDSEISAVQNVGRKSVNSFNSSDIKATERLAQQYWKEMGVKSPFFRAWFGDWRANDQTPIQVANQRGDARGIQRNEDTGWNVNVSGQVFNETNNHRSTASRSARQYLPWINDIIRSAILLDSHGLEVGKAKSNNSLLMHSLYAVADMGNGPEVLKLYVEEMNAPGAELTAKRAYQLQNIEKAFGASVRVQGNTPSSITNTSNTIRTVADLFAAVKLYDGNFTPNPPSKAVNKDGTPKIYYHGTNASWTVYDLQKNVNQVWGEGIYLAETEERARLYGDNVMPLYVRALYDNRDAKRLGVTKDHTRMKNGDMLVYAPEQIKSATDNIGTFDGTNPDIRYSIDDGTDLAADDFARVQAALKGQSRDWAENYLRNELGNDGYEQYRAWEKQQAEQKKLENREKAKARNAEKQAARKSVKDPVAESKPIRAKRELRQTVLNMFSIPEGSKAELGGVIDSFADRLLKNGAVTEEDRKHFFDRLYDAGVMTVPAEDYFSQGREILRGGRVYVPVSVRVDFGDDWNEIRRRAFGAGIYLTSDPNAGGIDSWNQELAELLPGLFDAEETDMRSILERVVEIAEEGQDNKMSLSEFTAVMAGRGEISADEFLDHMERQMDWALRTFAEKARLEISLRDRTGRQVAKERAVHKEMAQRQQARKELRQLQEKTLKTLRWLNQNRNRAPEELRAAWDEVLGDIDLYAIGAADETRWSNRYGATWKDLAQMYKDAKNHDPNFLPSEELKMIVDRLDGTKIEEMDLGALNDLYRAAVGLRTEFYNRNNVVNDEMNRLFAEVYKDAKSEIESAPGGYTGKAMDKLLNLEQLTPMNVLQRMGGWDPNGAFYSMAKQLEKGERDMRAYSVKAKRMLQEFLTENADWVKKADGQGKDGIWYEIEIPELMALELGKKPKFGATVKVYMTPAQKVHLYLESKNVDNLRHMTGGRTFADKKLYSEGKRQEALAQGKTVRMAPETVKALVSDLTEQEMELARLLEQYYNSFATGEINRISNILYGYDKAMGKNYAPIYTNKNYTKSEFGVFDQTAEGVGNLKGRQYAANPSYNISAFDAFERHVDQTARFVGMAIPTRNWTNLMNWQERNNSTGDVITHKWGQEAKQYITDLINNLQAGESIKTDAISSAVSKLQSTYITAIFGANPSIVLKQLGSIPLASAYLDAENVPTPGQIRSIDRELIGKYSQDLQWRTMGYSMPETKQLKENPNWTQTNKFYQFTFGGGAITAMDGWAASVLWPWAENKVRRDYPELEVGTQEQIDKGESPFYKKVAELFEEALSRSQSTSDEIHQSSLRKSKNPITKAFTMFRSDAAQTYNTLRQKIGEAQFLARTGATEQAQAVAKKAVGTAFFAMLMNALWAESINFLMALWKNKGKYYRDDEEKMTFGSVAGEMASGMVGSFAGIVTGGEEAAEVIGNLLTGKKIYDIETPGIEQLNDVITAVTSAGGNMRDVIAGAANVGANGGDMGRYFVQNSGKILGSIKDVAEATVMYIPGLAMSGLPVSNIEGYLLGAVKWLSPELGEAYDNIFRDTNKSDLSGASGKALQARIDQILRRRKVSAEENTAQALATLYEAGHKAAVPGDTPGSITVKGEKHTLKPYQQQTYETVWNSIVADSLDALVASDSFSAASEKEKAKLLNKLYDYAAESAKAELFDDYEMDGGAEAIRSISKAGLDVAECVAWSSESGELKQAEKFQLLRKWDMPDKAKRAVVGTLIGTEMKTEAGKDSQYAKMLEALEQGATVDEYLDMRLAGTNVDDFLELVEGGMDDDIAVDLLEDMAELEEGSPDVAKWRICVDFSNDVEDQLTALFGIMDTAQYQKVEIANSFGVNPDTYVRFQEWKPKYDADGNGSFKNAEIKAAIDAMPGKLTKEQKAVLWQLGTGSTSAKNNPYSREIGQKVLDAKAALKAKNNS